MNTEITKLQSDFARLSERILPCEFIAIVNEYVQLLYVGRCTRKDLWDMPHDITCMFMLNMHIYTHSNIYDVHTYSNVFAYNGEVEVIRTDSEFNFRFTMDENHYDYHSNDTIFEDTGTRMNCNDDDVIILFPQTPT